VSLAATGVPRGAGHARFTTPGHAEGGCMMVTVRQILESKGYDVWSVEPSATALEGLELMADKNIGALLVMHEGDLVGVFSERDFARKTAQIPETSRDTPVADMMTSKVIYVHPDLTIEECMAVMTRRHIRHLPVIREGVIIGVISIGDVVKALIAEKEFVIEQLENYIRFG
jgi:CBS domain-containing protein